MYLCYPRSTQMLRPATVGMDLKKTCEKCPVPVQRSDNGLIMPMRRRTELAFNRSR